MLKDEAGEVKAYAAVTGAGEVVFKDLVFGEPGIYKFTASQIDNGDERFVYDTAVIGYEVDVTLQDGKLAASWKTDSTPQFTTLYAAAAVELPILKELTNADTADVDFVFAASSGEATATLKGSDIVQGRGRTTMNGLTVDAPGTFRFAVSEQINKTDLNWEYDSTSRSYTVNVTRGADGALHAETGEVPSAFQNAKTQTSTTVTIAWTGSLIGNSSIPGSVLPDKVRVSVVREDGGVVQTKDVTQANNWTAEFNDLPRYELVNGERQQIYYTVEAEAPASFSAIVDGRFEDGYVVRMLYRHHQWSYRAEGNRIIATCADGKDCPLDDAIMYLELHAEDMTFNGEPYPESNLKVGGWAEVWEILEAKPYKLGFSSGSAPTAAGAYEALLTCGDAVAKDPFVISGDFFDVYVKVQWVDEHTPRKPLPKTVSVHLYAGKKLAAQADLTRNDGWACVFANMPGYMDETQTRGTQASPIQYTLKADAVKGFTQKITGDARNGYIVTYTAQKDVPITGDKTNLPLLIGLAAVSLGVLVLLLRRRETK